TLYVDGTIANGKVGLGFMALNDQMSPFSTTGFYGSTSYIFTLGMGWKFSVGVQGGVNILPVYGQGFTGRKKLGSFGGGVWLQNQQYYLGISKPELLRADFGTSNANWNYQLPLYLTTGGKIGLNSDFVLTPNLTAILSQDVKNEIHVCAKLWYKQWVGADAYFRTRDINRFHFVAEVPTGNNVRVGDAHDTRTVVSRYTIVGVGLARMNELLFHFIPNPSGFNYY